MGKFLRRLGIYSELTKRKRNNHALVSRLIITLFACCLIALSYSGCPEDDTCPVEDDDFDISTFADSDNSEETSQGNGCSEEEVDARAKKAGADYCNQFYSPGPPESFTNPKTGKVCKRGISIALATCKSVASKKFKAGICFICNLTGNPCDP